MKGLTEYKALIRLGIPVLVTQMGIIAVSFADTMMVGAYGTRELAAASFVNNVFLIPIVSLIGLAGGMTPVIGALFGQKMLREAGASFKSGLVINIAVAVLFSLAMGIIYFFLPYFGQPEELLPLIKTYYLIILSSVIPQAVFSCCQSTANGATDTAMPMWVMVSGNLLNILGNYLLIFGKFGCPELGLTGAGISTAVSRLLMAVAILAGFLIRKRYRVIKSGMSLTSGRKTYIHVWLTSYPIMIQSGMECFLWALGAVVCGWFGTYQLASYQITNIIGQFGFMIYLSAGVALSIRVANYTGVMDTEGIRNATRAGLRIMLVMATFASAVFFCAGRHLFGMFTPDENVIQAGIPLILPLILYQYFDAVQLTFGNALRGTSDVKPLITVSAVSYLVVGVVSLFLLAKGFDMGNVGVYYSFGITLMCAAIMLWHYYRTAVIKIERQKQES